jgi:predicted DNA-binding transcriptional regulator YafY
MPVEEIAATLKVAKKTIYRDLEAARVALGAPTLATILLAARDANWISGSERLTSSGIVATSIRALARGERQRRP